MRDLIRQLLRCVAGIGAWPYLIGYRASGMLLGRRRAFSAASERLSRLPGLWGLYVRAAFYGRTMAHVGRDVYFGYMSVLSKPETSIGDGVYIGRFCTVGLADLGDDVMLADGVQVLSGRHTHGAGPTGDRPMRDNPHQCQRVTIGHGAWLCAASTVMADVGADAVVAAGAVVVKPVASRQRVAGVPARPIATHRPASEIQKMHEIQADTTLKFPETDVEAA